MPRPGGNPNLCGNKNSGRKRMPVEMAKAQAIIKAWNKVAADIEGKDTKDIALPIALRDMTDKREVSGQVKLIQEMDPEEFKKMLNEYGPNKRTNGRGVITDVA